jgi:hypothetical protein
MPSAVRRIGPGVTKTAQSGQMRVTDAFSREGFRKRITIELRIVPGTRNSTNINKPFNTMSQQ